MQEINKKPFQNKLFYWAAVLSLIAIFLYELRYGFITIAYLIALPFVLLLSVSKRYTFFIGIVTSFFIVVGFLLSDFNDKSMLTNNRILVFVVIWLVIYYSIYYRDTLAKVYKTKNHLKAIFDNATEGILVINSIGEIIMVNPRALSLFNYEENELIGKKIEYLVPERFANSHLSHRKKFGVMPRNRPMGSALELYAKRKDSSEFLAEICLNSYKENEELLVIAFITDITARNQNLLKINQLNEELEVRVQDRTKKLSEAYHIMEKTNFDLNKEIAARESAEQTMIENQRLYEAMARHFPNGIIGIMNKEFKYILVNGRGLHEIGLDETKLLEEKAFENLYSAEHVAAQTELQKGFAGDTVSFELVINENYYNIKAVPLPEENNDIDKILIVLTNVTETKKNELAMLENLAREKQLGRMKSKFVSTASHEFRTPLSTIMTSAFLLQSYNGEDFEQAKEIHIKRINKSVKNLTDILNDFLSLSKLDEGIVDIEYDIIDINSFFNDIKTEMELQKPPDQILDYSHSGSRIMQSDKKLLRNIVLNLLSNAIKYSKPDGLIKVSSLVKSGRLTIEVEDRGIGIPKEDIPLIFKRFYRAENASYIQGTGLGLNIVKKYVELLGGKINCSSELNVGTTFTVELPLTAIPKRDTSNNLIPNSNEPHNSGYRRQL